MNLQDLSDEELDGLRIEVLTEQERRVIVATAADQIAALEQKYAEAVAGEPFATPLTMQTMIPGTSREPK